MALPVLTSLRQCASYELTVEPFVGQLRQLPAATARALIAAPGTRGGSLLALYLGTNPLVFGFAVSLVLGAVFFAAAEYNRNYSQVDRAWSLLPTLYIGHFTLWARLAGLPSQRLEAALLCSVVWSVRLTYNYARKGGYRVGEQDYRWAIVKESIPGWAFTLLDLTFIAYIQNILLYAIAAPAYVLLLASAVGSPTLTAVDVIFAATQLGLVACEWVADQQQWTYQTAKAQYRATGQVPLDRGVTQAALDRGFLAEGLWAYSRHPNFAAEQSVWLVLYQWSCVASGGTLYSWAGAGAAALVLLFQGSTMLTERITGGKYPGYADYQRQVGMFVPTSLTGYLSGGSSSGPKVIRTSDLAKRQAEKEKAAEAAAGAATGAASRGESAARRR